MSKEILITRSVSQAQNFSDELQALGYQICLAPMLEIIPVAIQDQNFESYVGFIFTSANALNHFSVLCEERMLPVYVVGDSNEEMAKRLGYENIFNTGANIEDLILYFKSERRPAQGPYLYLRGQDITRDLKNDLSNAGFDVDDLIVYQAQKVGALPADIIEKIKRFVVVYFNGACSESTSRRCNHL